jgi:hypothetical protein
VDLYEPMPGLRGAHGSFDSRAKDSSWELNLTTRASGLATLVSGAAGVLIRALAGGQGSAPSVDKSGQHGQQPLPAHQ